MTRLVGPLASALIVGLALLALGAHPVNVAAGAVGGAMGWPIGDGLRRAGARSYRALRRRWPVPSIAWWPEWVGSFDGRVTMRVTPLLAWRGWRVDLHRFEGVDDPGCFHTHPATALRVILRGGYEEEMEDGRREWWWAGRVGIVRPSLSHRVARVEAGATTLWIRGPKVARIQLRGPGWPRNLRPVMGAEVVPTVDPVTR